MDTQRSETKATRWPLTDGGCSGPGDRPDRHTVPRMAPGAGAVDATRGPEWQQSGGGGGGAARSLWAAIGEGQSTERGVPERQRSINPRLSVPFGARERATRSRQRRAAQRAAAVRRGRRRRLETWGKGCVCVHARAGSGRCRPRAVEPVSGKVADSEWGASESA